MRFVLEVNPTHAEAYARCATRQMLRSARWRSIGFRRADRPFQASTAAELKWPHVGALGTAGISGR